MNNVIKSNSLESLNIFLEEPIIKNDSNLANFYGTPSKNTNNLEEFPCSPTFNLKLLLKAASPDIRERNKNVNQYASDHLYNLNSNAKISILKKNNVKCLDSIKQNCFNRSHKSLSVLCDRFLNLFVKDPITKIKIINLKSACQELNVGRRRLYDILNVLEVIGVACHRSKNTYILQKKDLMIDFLQKLKKAAIAEDLESQIDKLLISQMSNEFQECEVNNLCHEYEPIISDNLKISLSYMTKKFVQIFLIKQKTRISLDLATKIISITTNNAGLKCRTALRRLYDVANILCAMNLIEKVKVKGEKSSFIYSGPHFDEIHLPKTIVEKQFVRSNLQNILTKYLSFDEANLLKTKEMFTEMNDCSSSNCQSITDDFKQIDFITNRKFNIEEKFNDFEINTNFNLSMDRLNYFNTTNNFNYNENSDCDKENIRNNINNCNYPVSFKRQEMQCEEMKPLKMKNKVTIHLKRDVNTPIINPLKDEKQVDKFNSVDKINCKPNIFFENSKNSSVTPRIINLISPRYDLVKSDIIPTVKSKLTFKRHLTCDDVNQKPALIQKLEATNQFFKHQLPKMPKVIIKANNNC